MYTLVQQMVDQAIGDVIAAIPRSQLADTVIVFASDHGEYAGAHGLLSGKLGTAYEEAINIPLIVTDLTHRFTKKVHEPRKQLASSCRPGADAGHARRPRQHLVENGELSSMVSA